MNGPSPVETMIFLLAQEVRDDELTAVGTLSPLPAAAAYLAQMTHAPRARLAILDSPEWPFEGELEELFNLAQRGRVGLFFLSGAQIDRQANLNLIAVGDYARPKVRLPGGAGSAMVYLQVERTVLFLRSQSARSLVERVDFVTAPGGAPGPDRPGGPTRLITDLAVFDYQPGQGLVPASLHPGVSLADVAAKTGWEVKGPASLPASTTPDQETLALIHGPVKDKVARIYPLFAGEI
jgi:glutaconate CoA-transferase subunit B